MLTVRRTREGLAYLHLWREGDEYFAQKGHRFLPEWTNVMYVAVPEPPVAGVEYVDLSAGHLPVADATFDAVNAYHVLEHLTPSEGLAFARELFRVTKPGAVVRVSTPDLETICREYLAYLDAVLAEPTRANQRRYDWRVMEMFEQMVREREGGMMMEAIRAGEYEPEDMESRYSDVLGPMLRVSRGEPAAAREPASIPWRYRIANGVRWRAWRIGERFGYTPPPLDPGRTKERVRWMYDRVSLGALLRSAGFTDIVQRDFRTSDIPHWARFDLDRSNHADRAIDPSVYMEARRA